MGERIKMRAVVITAPRTCEVRIVDRPVPTPSQVLVRVEGCGVCGSNLSRWEGRAWFSYPGEPGTPGHEGWGRVVARGRDVTTVELGDRIAFLSDHAFAEYDVADASSIVVLPAALRDEDVPGEPLGCVMNIWRRTRAVPGDTIAIVGAGFLGVLLCQLAARSGVRAIAISQRAFSRQIAASMGAQHVIELDRSDEEIVAEVEHVTDGTLCDAVIEVVGLQRPLDLAAKLCRVRGRLVIAGFHQDGPRTFDSLLWNWRGLDVINAHEREPAAYVSGMAAAIDSIASGKLDPSLLYTHHIPLERAAEAFEALATRPPGFVKALMKP